MPSANSFSTPGICAALKHQPACISILPKYRIRSAALGSRVPPHILAHVTTDTLSPSITTGAPTMFEWSDSCTTITYAVITIPSNSDRLNEIALCFAHFAPTTDLLFSSVVRSYRHHTPVSARKPPTALRVASDNQCRSGSHFVWEKKGEYEDTPSTKNGSRKAHSHQSKPA